MKTVKETLVKSGDSCVIAKKGKKYIGEKAGEFCLVTSAVDAIAFESESEAERIIETALVDTRNAKVIGKSYGLTPLTRN